MGDIFGAPLAIEGILAFFMESTFIAIMFFGWNKVSKRFHLASTWLTAFGASLSAVWILVANAWMRVPAEQWISLEVVHGGFDAADDWIAEQVQRADIVVTADILLAGRCLEKEAVRWRCCQRRLGPSGSGHSHCSFRHRSGGFGEIRWRQRIHGR